MEDYNIIHGQAVNVDSLNSPESTSFHETTRNSNSKSLETLFQMHELANEKLKISLRRLSLSENEIEQLRRQLKELEEKNQSLHDQIYLSNDKEKKLKISFQQMSEQVEIYKVQYEMIATREEELKLEVARLKKYQEKINTQVKPYFKQLKEYSKSLETQNEKISSQLEHKDVQIIELKNQLGEVIKNFQFQTDIDRRKFENTLNHYEEQVSELSNNLRDLKEQNKNLESKIQEHEDYHQRFLETENKFIELERFFKQKREEFETELSYKKSKIQELTRNEYKYFTESEDLKLSIKTLIEETKILKENVSNKDKQLETMQFLWEQKNNENEKLKSAINSLEKINIELSQNFNTAKSLS